MDDLDLGATIKGFSPGQKVFSRYTLKKILGRGGMGVVWLARDEELDREVALKFLPEIVALDPEAVADLKRETRRNLDLTHPHIVRIHDFVTDSRAAAISMEYIDGASLSALKLQKPGRMFPVAELTPWIKQLCAALTYAHTEAQVVHRDLKPANLMVDARGRLKITDFGIARGISDSVSRVSAQAGSSAGTPLYMSPQQMLGEKPTVADDIYALGATLYELLTGKPPFHSGNVPLQVQTKLPPAIAARRRELDVDGEPVPAAWEETIAACLAKEAKDRPASMEELWQRLSGRPAAGGAAPVRPAGGAGQPAPAAPRPAQSRTPLIGAAAAGVILLGAAGWYFGVHAPEQERLARISSLEEQGRAAEALKLKTEQERTAMAAARQANARGGIIVRSTPPGAEVTVGALEHGVAPLTLKEVKLGKYVVKARLAGHEDWTGEVEVKENDFATITAELAPWSGQLVLTAGPAGAEAEIRPPNRPAENRRIGLPQTLKLTPGSYEIVFRRAGWLDRTRRVVVERNKSVSLAETYASAGQAPGWYVKAGAGELRAAAEAGDLEARVRLGDRHYLGLDGTVDMPRAYAEYQLALAAKYPAVYSRLGNLLKDYVLEPQSWVKSMQMWRDGALAGEPIAILNWHSRVVSRQTRESAPMFSATEVSQALIRVRQQAEAGDVNAMREVSWVYRQGVGVTTDPAEAQRWLKAALDAGDAGAMVQYAGELLQQKKNTEALTWLNKAVEKNLAGAKNTLGWRYLNGEVVAPDAARALRYFREAAEQGLTAGMGSLASLYVSGKAGAADPAEAFRWRQKAAESGQPGWLYAQAEAHRHGVGTAEDPARAVELYEKAAEWNHPSALLQLGILYQSGKGVAQNYTQALSVFQMGAELGDARCMSWLGYMYREGQGVTKDDYRAMQLFRQGADKGNASCMYWLGIHHVEGRAAPRDENQAIDWFRKSAKIGYAGAQEELKKRNLTW